MLYPADAADSLDFTALKTMVGERAATPQARRRIEELQPEFSWEAQAEELERTDQMLTLYQQGHFLPAVATADTASALTLLRVREAVLSPEQFLALKAQTESYQNLYRFCGLHRASMPAVVQLLERTPPVDEVPLWIDKILERKLLSLICKIKEISTEKIEEKLKIVNLFERRNSKFKTYSLGMKQRLAIASALLNNPEILILDEPTNGLDPQGIHEIREIIQKIAKNGTTILLASHLLDEVEKVCSHVVVIRDGVKLYSGRVDKMSASHGLFELNTNEPKNKLISILNNNSQIGSVKEEGDYIIAYLTEEMEASEINSYLFKNGITVSHLVKRKPSLEEQFLDLTNNN